MLDHKVSPLLDAMEIGECFAGHDGTSCCWIRHPGSGREFVLKHISVPAGEDRVEALLLTGAYANEEEADAYYRKVAEALVREAENRKALLDCPYILPFLGVQMEKKQGVGYDVYAVMPKRNSLETYLAEHAVSHLRGLNMGIDLCEALSALREEGYVHGNLKPGNVFFSDTGRFQLGDFGLISTEDIQYAVLPEHYRSCYSAPELSSLMGGLNATVDIYSLGMILYRIYNGNHAPFEDEQTDPQEADAKRIAGEALPAPIYADYELAGIICKACAFDPAERYQTPDEMRLELEQYMRRNAVSDHLIVPPLVTDDEPLHPEETEEETEPVRPAEPERPDERAQKPDAPDESRKSGREKPDKKPEVKAENKPESKPEQKPESKPEKQAESKPEKQAGKKPEWRQNGASASQRADRKPADRKPAERSVSPWPTEAPAEKKRGKGEKRGKRGLIAFVVLLVLLLVGIGLYEFTDLGKGRWHYFVTVDELEVSSVTADSLRLRITTEANPADFTVTCRDSFGNAVTGSFQGDVALVRGLNPNTQYEIQVELPGLHKLSGRTTASASTKALTEVLSFRAEPAEGAGSVRLELSLRDESTAPAFWTLNFGKTGQEPRTVQFAGTSCRLDGLENGAPYTFTLVQTENLYLAGETQVEYTPLQPVAASDLRLDALQEGSARLTWLCTTDLPVSWALHCADGEGKELNVEYEEPRTEADGWHCAARISGLVRDVDYSVRLSAPGLAVPLTMTLRDSGVKLTEFTGEATGEGLELHWSADRIPDAGWRIIAAFGNGLKLETLAHGDSCTMAVLPDTEYTVTILPADGSSVSGENSLQIESQWDRRFAEMGVNYATTIGLYDRPDKEGYEYSDLNLMGNVRFSRDELISFAIVAGGWPIDSDETVTVLYAIFDENSGETLSAASEQRVWNEIWESDHFVGDLRREWLPKEPGYYAFCVYINSKRLGTIRFTLED